jgi:acetyltransferase-like isoleucine patch superfamily enzyme
MNTPQKPPPFIHPLAVVETEMVGCGTRIWAWSHLQKDVVIGEYCNIGEHCFLENGVRIGNRVVIKNGISLWEGIHVADDVFIGPHAVFTNERFPRAGFRKKYEPITIAEGASIGAGAVITPGIKLGRYATVGAGSVVTHDIPDHALVTGNPASFHAWMCICGLKLKLDEPNNQSVCECGAKYEFVSGMCKRINSET